MAPPSSSTGAAPAAPSPDDAASIPVTEPLPAFLSNSTPEQQLTHALACFQAEVSAIASPDLGSVAEAARPAFQKGIGWSAHLREQQGRSRLQVTLMHVAGAELCSESWADETSDVAGMTGLMLAMLLGIPVSAQARTAEPCFADEQGSADKPVGDSGQQAQASVATEPVSQDRASGLSTVAEDDPALIPLTEEEISDFHRRVLDLPQATRRELTAAFREHFQVPRNARSIGDRITQRQHGLFIEHFLEEAKGLVQAEPSSPPAP